MEVFKRWYLTGNIKDLKGRFNKLADLRDEVQRLDAVLSRLNTPLHDRENLKYKTLSFIVKRGRF